MKRNLGKCTNKVKSKAHTTLIHPILEYATQVCDPCQQSLVHKIEMIQIRAARWAFSNYDFNSSVTAMLKDLNWPTLEERQKRTDCHSYLELFIVKNQPYKYPSIFCHRPPPPDNSTNYASYYQQLTPYTTNNVFLQNCQRMEQAAAI